MKLENMVKEIEQNVSGIWTILNWLNLAMVVWFKAQGNFCLKMPQKNDA